MTFPTDTIAVFVALISGYALYHSQSSIPKLRKYEERAERAAEWSKAAEKRLWDTRYTVGAGFVATLLSLVSAVVYAFFVPRGFNVWRIGWPAVLAAGQKYASQYMNSFWSDKAKVPLMDDYNEAISDSKNVIGFLDVLTVGWGVIGVLKAVGL